MAENECEYDHNVTRRLKAAGFVIVGTTTLPEYGILPVSEARIFGPTRNPWDLGRTPGGSSGGAAAAVASGMLPVAHGNDGGGSIRIPAACCGLVGLKAAPRADLDGAGARRLAARRRRHAHAQRRRHRGDPRRARRLRAWRRDLGSAAARAVCAARRAGPGLLRIAATDAAARSPTRRSIRPAARPSADAAELLRSLGHSVEEVDPPWQVEGLSELFGVVFSNHIALSIAYSGIVAGREPTAADMEPMSWAIFSMIKQLGAIEGLAAAAQLQSFARRLVAFLEPYDALLTPALAQRPLPIGTLDTAAPDPMSTFTPSGLFTPFTPVFNATGQPAISLPLFQGEDGLPLAVQIVGRPAGEGACSRSPRSWKRRVPWAGRRPGQTGAGAD